MPKMEKLYDFEPPRRAVSAKEPIRPVRKFTPVSQPLNGLCPVVTRKKLIRIGKCEPV